jgi:hypothetical protein
MWLHQKNRQVALAVFLLLAAARWDDGVFIVDLSR